jgi:hypothetical protein
LVRRPIPKRQKPLRWIREVFIASLPVWSPIRKLSRNGLLGTTREIDNFLEGLQRRGTLPAHCASHERGVYRYVGKGTEDRAVSQLKNSEEVRFRRQAKVKARFAKHSVCDRRMFASTSRRSRTAHRGFREKGEWMPATAEAVHSLQSDLSSKNREIRAFSAYFG